MGETGEACPFEFSFNEKTFKPGDTVSYRANGSLEGFPFAGDPNDPAKLYRGTRESRPMVDYSEI